MSRWLTAAFRVLAVVVICSLAVGLFAVVTVLGDQRAGDLRNLRQGCEVRNRATLANIDRETRLGRLQQSAADPTLRRESALHFTSAAELRGQMIDCSRLFR